MKLRLHKRQQVVLSTLLDQHIGELLYGGAAGGGKSYLLRAIACIFAIQCPGISIYLFRRRVKDLRATHLQGAMSFPIILDEFLGDGLVHINKSTNLIEFKNNSVITLAHIQYEADLENYLSAEIHVCLFDEATTFLPKMLRFIRSRVRLGSLDIPDNLKNVLPFIIYATNPRGPSHHYFKSGWVDAAKSMSKFVALPSDGGMTRMFIPALLSDNPSLTKNDPEYANRLKGLGDDDIVKAYLEGDWSVVEGAALPKFSRDFHVMDKFNIPSNWKIYRAYDYGFSAPYSVLFFAIASGESAEVFGDKAVKEGVVGDEGSESNNREICPVKDTVIIIGEIYGDDGKENGLREDVGTTAIKIKRFEEERGWQVFPGPADNSIFDREQGPSISSIMWDKGISWERSNKSPGSRINGLALCRQFIANSLARPQEKPGLFIFDSCPRLIYHLSNLQLDDKTGEDVETHGQPDHDWDALRYILLNRVKTIKTVGVFGA